MKKVLLIILFVLLFAGLLFAQYPAQEWMMYQSPEDGGYASAKIQAAKQLYDSLGCAAFMFVDDGVVVVAWGDLERRFMCHSVRKSFLSAMYGVQVARGVIDLDKTIGELEITDNLPLTEDEKSARVRDLLKARSGIYLPAAYETPGMKARRPKRGSHKPDTFWYYNNWDFNVLGVIYKRTTGHDIFLDFKRLFADPLQMQDYRVIDGYYHIEPENSIHPAYPFRMSARDMARFGLLFLRNGKWNGKQILPESWVKESTKAYSTSGNVGYGYLWWIGQSKKLPGLYTARGAGGHVIGVVPEKKIVFVHRANTFKGPRVPTEQIIRLAELVAEAKTAKPGANARLVPLPKTHSTPPTIPLSEEEKRAFVDRYDIDGHTFYVVMYQGDLLLATPERGKFRLLPVAKNVFLIEDWQDYLIFEEIDGKLTPRLARLPE